KFKPKQRSQYQQIFILKSPLDIPIIQKPNIQNNIQQTEKQIDRKSNSSNHNNEKIQNQQIQIKQKKNEQNIENISQQKQKFKRYEQKLLKSQKINYKKDDRYEFDEKFKKLYIKNNKKQKQEKTIKNNNKIQNKQLIKNKQFQFSDYWTKEDIEKAITQKKAYQGTFISNEKNSILAKIRCEDFNNLIYINSLRDQNRALNSQKVGFVIYEDLKKPKEKNDYKNLHLNKNLKIKQKNNNNEWETQSESIEDKEQIEDTQSKRRLVGKVVYIFNDQIVDQNVFIGTLQQQRDGKMLFLPNNNRYPRMIPILGDNIKKFQGQIKDFYVKGTLKNWERNQQNPTILCEDILGSIGDIEIECRALLEENQIISDDFSIKTKEYLDKKVNEQEEIIPKEERKKRLDLTKEIIFTIDPVDARDLDDALSIKLIEKNKIVEIGVHIADVSFFVKEGSPVDLDAQLRTTSVYLVHRVITMLPRILCDNLCSLNSNAERLAFSVFFQMDFQGNLIQDFKPIFVKSIINSCSKFSYDTVQKIIDGEIQNYSQIIIQLYINKYIINRQLPEQNKVREGINGDEMFEKILLLSKIGMEKRKRRTENGVLTIENSKKRFCLDPNTLFPQSYTIEVRKEANFIVEEFMLLANQLVGKKIVESCEEISVLRRHEYPQEKKQERFNDTLEKLKLQKIQFKNLNQLINFLKEIQQNENISEQKKIFLKKQLFLILEPAQYFIANLLEKDQWKHFALNFDVYTHFTSPIRRYPDLIVHRVLEQVLLHEKEAKNYVNRQNIVNILQDCNIKKYKAKKVSEGCQKVQFLFSFFNLFAFIILDFPLSLSQKKSCKSIRNDNYIWNSQFQYFCT
ncbi:rnb family protein, putative, partial [Ichthyophthirius multifiliis]